MKISALIICLSVVLLTGCPKRQTARRLIYTPPPPASSQAPAPQQGGVLVIAPPPAPAPATAPTKPEETAASIPEPKRQPEHREAPSGPPETAAAPPAAPPAAAPQLVPATTTAQQVELESKFRGLRDTLQQRIGRLHRRTLSAGDQKALKDAELWLSEAVQAMSEGDLQQALSLAQKADILVSAVEKGH